MNLGPVRGHSRSSLLKVFKLIILIIGQKWPQEFFRNGKGLGHLGGTGGRARRAPGSGGVSEITVRAATKSD